MSFATALRSRYGRFAFASRFAALASVKFDDELIRLDLDPDDMIVDEDCVFDLGGFVEVISNGFGDEVLDLFCRDSADGAGLLGPALQQGR